MNYSSAWFEGRPDGDLERAQSAKVRRALRQAGVLSGSRDFIPGSSGMHK